MPSTFADPITAMWLPLPLRSVTYVVLPSVNVSFVSKSYLTNRLLAMLRGRTVVVNSLTVLPMVAVRVTCVSVAGKLTIPVVVMMLSSDDVHVTGMPPAVAGSTMSVVTVCSTVTMLAASSCFIWSISS